MVSIKKQPSLILLFNHTLTAPQEADARASLGVARIVEPPPDIRTIWAEVPPATEQIGDWLAPVFAWLASAAVPGDFVLIQGEFGATWLAVQQAFASGLIPIYSTTSRKAVEERLPDGSVHIRHIFSHVRYRRYQGKVKVESQMTGPGRLLAAGLSAAGRRETREAADTKESKPGGHAPF